MISLFFHPVTDVRISAVQRAFSEGLGMNQLLAYGVAGLLAIGGTCLGGDEWSRFRGPNGSAVSMETNLPMTWSDEKGVLWKTKLPGPGSSSPIVIGDRIFITAYSGYGDLAPDIDAGEQKDLGFHVICVNRTSGRILWQKPVQPRLPESPFRPPGKEPHPMAIPRVLRPRTERGFIRSLGKRGCSRSTSRGSSFGIPTSDRTLTG